VRNDAAPQAISADHTKRIASEMMRFPFSWSTRVREKRLLAAWKIYVAGPFNRYIAFVGSTSPSLASKRKIYESEKRTELSQTTAF